MKKMTMFFNALQLFFHYSKQSVCTHLKPWLNSEFMIGVDKCERLFVIVCVFHFQTKRMKFFLFAQRLNVYIISGHMHEQHVFRRLIFHEKKNIVQVRPTTTKLI